MRCTRCGYISFKALKKCENCGAVVGKADKARSLRKKSRNEEKPFTIFPQADDGFSYELPTPLSAETEAQEESYLTPPGQVVHPVFNAEGDFDLDLSGAFVTSASGAGNVEDSARKGPAASTHAFGFEIPSQIYNEEEELDEIDLGEIEVEGLGFEGLDAEFAVPQEDSAEDDRDTGVRVELNEPQGEPVAEEEPQETPSILDELDLDFDPDEDEEASTKGSDSKKTG